MDTKLATKRTLIGFSITLAILAGFDIVTTHYGISLGAIELNLLLRNLTLPTIMCIKGIVTALIIAVCLYFKTLIGLALLIGINLACVCGNISTIILLR